MTTDVIKNAALLRRENTDENKIHHFIAFPRLPRLSTQTSRWQSKLARQSLPIWSAIVLAATWSRTTHPTNHQQYRRPGKQGARQISK